MYRFHSNADERRMKTLMNPDEEMGLFIKRHRKMVSGLKDFRRSQAAKSAWRKSRYRYMKGIRRFHKSTKGKRFHRALGRFLSSRIIGEEDARTDLAVGVSSCITHLLIETRYFAPAEEKAEYDLMHEECSVRLSRVVLRLLEGKEVTLEDVDVIATIANPAEFDNGNDLSILEGLRHCMDHPDLTFSEALSGLRGEKS